MVRDRGDKATNDLLSWEPPQVAVGYSEEVAGKGELQNKIARLISRALRDARDAGMSHALVAQELSQEIGRSVSEDMLNKWASEASDAHRISLDAFIGLIRVTEATELLGFVPQMFGFIVVDRKFEGFIELQLADEREAEINAYRERARAKLRSQR